MRDPSAQYSGIVQYLSLRTVVMQDVEQDNNMIFFCTEPLPHTVPVHCSTDYRFRIVASCLIYTALAAAFARLITSAES